MAGSAAREVLERLYVRYVDALDDDQLEAWPELFTETCLYRVTSAENDRLGLPLAVIRAESRGMLRDRVTALRSTAMYIPRTVRHLVTNVDVVDVSETTIRARARFVVFQTLPGEPTQLFVTGVYRDVVDREGEGWYFRDKLCVYDGLIPNSLVIPL
jgi:3-phenylpropionate/cinnamic acid dioxygenase small subunit